MGELALGALSAVTASVLFSVGLVLQSLEARTMPGEYSLRLSLITHLLGRWLAGCLTMVAGFGFHVLALLLAPLAVVQPSLTAGLVVLLVAGIREDAEPVHAREVLAVIAIGIGRRGRHPRCRPTHCAVREHRSFGPGARARWRRRRSPPTVSGCGVGVTTARRACRRRWARARARRSRSRA